MARPKTVKLFGGEVILKNLPKDKQDLIALYLDTLVAIPDGQPVPALTAEKALEFLNEPSSLSPAAKIEIVSQMIESEADGLALGMHKDSDGIYSLVDVKYNITTKEAFVENVKRIGKHKDVANSEFRVKAAQKLMV
jgi:hypothetical protein